MVDGVRGTQEYVENVIGPTTTRGPRASQEYVENVVGPTTTRGPRASQVYVENIRSTLDLAPLAPGANRIMVVTGAGG